MTELHQAIRQHYHFHTYHSVPTSYGYQLETNCGTKKVMLWQHESVCAWHFRWREKLAKEGLRHAARFIRAQDGAPYVELNGSKQNKAWISVHDHLPDKRIQWNKELVSELGQWVGQLFRCFFHVTQEMRKHDLKRERELRTRVDQTDNEKHFSELKKRIVTQPDSLVVSLVRYHWAQIEQRKRTAQALLRQQLPTFISLPELSLQQFIFGPVGEVELNTNTKGVSEGFNGLVQLINQIIAEDANQNELAQSFYLAFEKVYGLQVEEQLQILGLFIYPKRFIALAQDIFMKGVGEEKTLQQWMRECEHQERMDGFQRWLAQRIDRFREDAMSL